MESGTPEAVELLTQITGDRGDVFDRIIWMTQRLVQLIDTGSDDAVTAAVA